jgi:hypothetical protein
MFYKIGPITSVVEVHVKKVLSNIGIFLVQILSHILNHLVIGFSENFLLIFVKKCKNIDAFLITRFVSVVNN